MPHFKGKLLDAGCGQMPYRNYILENSDVEKYVGLDIETAIEYNKEVKPDYTWDGKTMPFHNEMFDTILATEVLEHCPNPNATLSEIYRVLCKDGHIFMTVPFLWNLHETPHDEYRYTPFALNRLLNETGFKNIEIRAGGGWHASLAQMMGLWVRRSGLPHRKKKLLSIIFKPIIKYLLKKDVPPTEFREGQMITNLFIFATK